MNLNPADFRNHPRVASTRSKRTQWIERALTFVILLVALYAFWVGHLLPTYEPTFGKDTAVWLSAMFLYGLTMTTFGAMFTLLVLTTRPRSRGVQS